jgi:hypothetical protein
MEELVFPAGQPADEIQDSILILQIEVLLFTAAPQ